MIENIKLCKKCKETKPISNFLNKKNCLRPRCAACRSEDKRDARRKNVEKYRLMEKEYKIRNPERTILKNIKSRAKRSNIPFNLELSDIIIPEFCPVLGIKLSKISNKLCDNTPSVDRLIPEKGYVKGNITIISYRANTIKNNGTVEEHQKIIQYMIDNSKKDVTIL